MDMPFCCTHAVSASCTTRRPPREQRGFPVLGVRNVPALEGMMNSVKANYFFATVICIRFGYLILACYTKQKTKDAHAHYCTFTTPVSL